MLEVQLVTGLFGEGLTMLLEASAFRVHTRRCDRPPSFWLMVSTQLEENLSTAIALSIPEVDA